MAYSLNDIDLIEDLVIHLATLYDQGEECLDFDNNPVSNTEYDDLVKHLHKNRPDSKAFQPGTNTPSTYIPGGKLVKHHPPMTSIAKADGKDKKTIYEKWIKECCDQLGYEYPPKPGRFAQSYKHDGVAVRLYYVKGKLVKAGLRPRNGVNGIDVTENIQYVKGIAQELPLPLTLALGGELECLLSDFQKVQKAREEDGEDLRKNPRNHTYGGINQQKEPTKTKAAKISFMGYNIVGFDDSHKYYNTEIERAKWANKTLKIPFVQVRDHRFEDLATMENFVPALDYEVDGAVLKVNNLEDQEQLGHHGNDEVKEPRGALAWKFAEEHKQGKVKEIEWNVSRTGRVPPVAILEKGIQLAGTTVTRITCSNYGWLERMKIGVGTIIDVFKAGKIIPKIDHVVSHGVNKVEHPANCPACNEKLVIVNGAPPNKELMCENKSCPAKQVVGISFFLETLECKGLGEAKIERILSAGKVKTFADLYTLKLGDFGDLTEREALLALATIHMVKSQKDNDKLLASIEKACEQKKKVPAWQFFAALGIPGSGKTAGKALISEFGSMDKIMNATEEELKEVQGIGEISAPVIVDYFNKNSKMVKSLLEHIELELPKVGKLSGVTFVLTGGFPSGKTSIEKQIEDLGGTCGSSVSKTTKYVIVGENAGSKAKKATKLGIEMLTLAEFQKLIGN